MVVDWLFRSREEPVALQQEMAESCSDHKVTELRIQRKARKVNSRFSILDFESSDFGLFGALIVKGRKQPSGCSEF